MLITTPTIFNSLDVVESRMLSKGESWGFQYSPQPLPHEIPALPAPTLASRVSLTVTARNEHGGCPY